MGRRKAPGATAEEDAARRGDAADRARRRRAARHRTGRRFVGGEAARGTDDRGEVDN